MRLQAYRQVLGIPGLRSMLVLGVLAKIPVVAIPMILTLHVTAEQRLGFGRAGLLVALWTAGVAVGAPFQGRHIDRHGLRPLLVVASVCQALFWVSASRMPYPVLLGAALLSGLVLVPGTTISRLVISGLVPEERRHTAYAVDSMLTNVSYMIGPALGVALATQASSTVAFRGVGLLLVVSGVAVIVVNPALEPGGEDRPADSARPPLRQWLNRGLVATLACTFAAGMFSSGAEIGVVGSLQQRDQVGWITPVILVFGVCSMTGGILYGGLRRSPSAALIVACLGAVTLPLGLAARAPWLALALLPAALLYAPAFASTASAASAFSVAGARATAMSVYSTAMTVGTALGGPLVGAVLDRWGPGWAFATVGASILVISLLTLPLLGHRARGAAAASTTPSETSKLEPVMSLAKHVVIVDSYAPTMRLAEHFQRAGATLVRVQSTKEVPHVYRSSFSTDLYVDNIVHEDLGTTAARVAAYDPVAVVAGGENGVELADALSSALGVPSNGVQLSEARRDKYVMIETIKRAGVPAARQIMVGDGEQLEAWHRSIGGRVVVKPVRSAAGDHVFFCDTPEEALAAYRKIDGATNVFSERNHGVVAQEYLCGTEYIVNTVSRDGHHRICEIWRTSRLAVNGLSDLADAAYLIDRRGEAQDRLAAYSARVLDALGIRHGPAHLEVKLTNDGPRLVEVGARIAGGNIPSHAQLSIGESQLDWTVRAYLDPEGFHRGADEDYRRSRYVANLALISPVEGILRGYRDLDAIRRLESFHDMQVYVQPGERISRTVDDVTYAAAMLLLHDTEEVVLRDANTVRFLDGAGFYELEPEGEGA
ncbi:MFS transporter [Streptomyces massasporeus]|uniref:MFS transporter n=1 Tax=Streptomyces massasporeus TaxID=67324 RepID=UPI0037214F14